MSTELVLSLPDRAPRSRIARTTSALVAALVCLVGLVGTAPPANALAGPPASTTAALPAAPPDTDDPEPDPQTGPETDTDPGTVTDPGTDTDSELETDPDADPEPEPTPETDPATDTDTDTTIPGFPTETPPGFTDEQFRRFVGVVQACGLDGGRICETVLSWTGNQTLAETTQWVFDVPLRLALILFAAFMANRLVRRLIRKYAERLRNRALATPDADPSTYRRQTLRVATASATIGGTATAAIIAVTALVVLGELGITLGPLLAGAGIAGIALGFGAQNLVRDVLAGLFVVFEDQYGVGDIIDAGRCTGVVEDFTLRITKVRDVHGTLWFVPNGAIEEVGNLTQLWARAIIDFDIDYRADHEHAGRIIKATADRMWQDEDAPVRIIEEPELWGVEQLGDSAVVVRIAVKCAPAQQWKVARLLRGEVKKALDAEGISIPFPQHTVWVHGDPAQIGTLPEPTSV